MNSSDPLSFLRDAVAQVDRAMLELLRHRLELAAEIGRIKAEAGLPVVVRDVETSVLSRARQHAEACGVSEEVMEAVFQAIIRGSVERQYRVGIARRELHGERVLIVGGAGGMGTWFRAFLELEGHNVEVADPALATLPATPGRFGGLSLVEDLDRYAAILVAVPLDRTGEVVQQVVERSPRGLVLEVASIQTPVKEALLLARQRGVRALALHPMFGPGKSLYEPLTFVLATLGDPQEEKHWLGELLSHPYTRLVTVPFEHHDRLMGWLLGLAHLTNMLFGTALIRSGVDPSELHACASTTFTRQAATALKVLSEDPDLYIDIQHLNPHRHEVYNAAREALDQLEPLVERRDREGFRKILAAARRALTGDA
ncbi:MAG TPA: chorismate mutase [Thermoanaerobaculia bacterium]|nr:chorismate mutase [Thermoanaerobaculia bacterium]